jgi:hypothetical protein
MNLSGGGATSVSEPRARTLRGFVLSDGPEAGLDRFPFSTTVFALFDLAFGFAFDFAFTLMPLLAFPALVVFFLSCLPGVRFPTARGAALTGFLIAFMAS